MLKPPDKMLLWGYRVIVVILPFMGLAMIVAPFISPSLYPNWFGMITTGVLALAVWVYILRNFDKLKQILTDTAD